MVVQVMVAMEYGCDDLLVSVCPGSGKAHTGWCHLVGLSELYPGCGLEEALFLRPSPQRSLISQTLPGARGKSAYQGKTRADFFNARNTSMLIESPALDTTSQPAFPRPALSSRPKRQKFKDEVTYDQMLREVKFPGNNMVLGEATGADFD